MELFADGWSRQTDVGRERFPRNACRGELVEIAGGLIASPRTVSRHQERALPGRPNACPVSSHHTSRSRSDLSVARPPDELVHGLR
jgi:hypothetical protein